MGLGRSCRRPRRPQAFSLGLNKRLDDRSHNLAFSPLSVYVALSLGAAGARGRTLQELLGILGAPSRDLLAGHVCTLAEQALADRSQTGGPRVSFSCGMWHDTTMPLRPAYRDVAAESYKVSFSMTMNNVLRDMGLKVAFERGKADLSDMADDGAGLALQDVIHQAVIEVNEEGTEAAAATVMIFDMVCLQDPVDFVADHPFAFFVIEEVSRAILFAGHVVDPTIK